MDPKKLIGKGVIVEPCREKRHVLGDGFFVDDTFDLPVGSMCGKLVLVRDENCDACDACYASRFFSDIPERDAMKLCFATLCYHRERQDETNVVWAFNDGKKHIE